MAELGGAFDSGGHDDMNTGFDPIPAGKYAAQVVESDFKPTARKDGKYIKLKFEILEGEFKGRFIWTNLNVVNPNPVAVDIANKELATLCRACGVSVIQNTEQLHGIPIRMKIKIKPAKGDYPAGNEPIGYEALTVGAQSGTPDFAAEGQDESASKEAAETGDVPWPTE